MLAAETWAVEHGYSTIGLHTTAWLPGPLRLYRSLGYREDSLPLERAVQPEDEAACPPGFAVERLPGDSAAGSPANSLQSRLDALWELRYKTFVSLLEQPPASDGELAELYPRFRRVPVVYGPEYATFVARRTSDGELVGAIVGKMMNDACWIVVLEMRALAQGICPRRLQCYSGVAHGVGWKPILVSCFVELGQE